MLLGSCQAKFLLYVRLFFKTISGYNWVLTHAVKQLGGAGLPVEFLLKIVVVLESRPLD